MPKYDLCSFRTNHAPPSFGMILGLSAISVSQSLGAGSPGKMTKPGYSYLVSSVWPSTTHPRERPLSASVAAIDAHNRVAASHDGCVSGQQSSRR